MKRLYESLFNINNPDKVRKAIDVYRIEDIKNKFDNIFKGDQLNGTKQLGGGLDENLYITDDNILNISKLRKMDTVGLHMKLDNNTKKFFDKYIISGINFIPVRKNNNPGSMLTLYVPEKTDIDLKINDRPFEIINTNNMFSQIDIDVWDDDLAYPPYVKNLNLIGNDDCDVTVYNHMLDSCDLGVCKSVGFIMPDISKGTKPDTILKNIMKNCKMNTPIFQFKAVIDNDHDTFLAWRDYLLDNGNPRKDLLNRLSVKNSTSLNEIILTLINDAPPYERIIISTDISNYHRNNQIEKLLGSNNVSGISRAVMAFQRYPINI